MRGGATGIGALGLHDNDANATGTMEFQGNLGAASLVTVARGYAVRLLGLTTAVTADTNFLNTGNITFGNDDLDDFLFQGGLTSIAAGNNVFRGTVRTSGGIGQNISLDDLSLGGILKLNAGASGNFIFTGTVAVSNSSGNADVSNANGFFDNDLTVTAALINAGSGTVNIAANATLDFGGSEFIIGTLSNLGSLRVSGIQATHTFVTFDTDSGFVEYYGTSPASLVFTTGFATGTYWDLRIAGSGAGVHSLEGAIIVNNDLRIQTGVLDVTAANNYQITVAGNWRNDVGNLGFLSRSGTVTFDKPAGIIYIRGNNTWYVFECVPCRVLAFSLRITVHKASSLEAFSEFEERPGVRERRFPWTGSHPVRIRRLRSPVWKIRCSGSSILFLARRWTCNSSMCGTATRDQIQRTFRRMFMQDTQPRSINGTSSGWQSCMRFIAHIRGFRLQWQDRSVRVDDRGCGWQ